MQLDAARFAISVIVVVKPRLLGVPARCTVVLLHEVATWTPCFGITVSMKMQKKFLKA